MRANLRRPAAARRAAAAGDPRLRRDRPAPDRERDPGRAGHHPARRARPGEEPHRALAGRRCSTSGCRSWPARSCTTTRCGRSARTRARSSPSRATTRRWRGCIAADRYGEKLATPDITHRRPDRRGRPGQGRGGSLPVRRADDPLRPAAAHQPRHLRPQRAAGPRRADPGRPPQRDGGAGRPDPRLQVRLDLDLFVVASRQPGGLHQPGPDHHAR